MMNRCAKFCTFLDTYKDFSDVVFRVLAEPCEFGEEGDNVIFEGCAWECSASLNDDVLGSYAEVCYTENGENGMGSDVTFVGVVLDFPF